MAFDTAQYGQLASSPEISSTASRQNYFGMNRASIVMNPAFSEIEAYGEAELAIPPPSIKVKPRLLQLSRTVCGSQCVFQEMGAP
jgi:hypothetical protein